MRGILLEGAVSARRAIGFGDHPEVALIFQYAAVALPDDRVVVDKQDRNVFCLQSHHGQPRQAAIGIVAATFRPCVARAIESEPPTAAILSRIPVRPKPADCATQTASPPPSSSTLIRREFSAPPRRSLRHRITRDATWRRGVARQ